MDSQSVGEKPEAPRSSVSVGYAWFALALLSLTYSLSIADRIVLGIVQESLRGEFGLSDFDLGLLGGTAFALCYSLCGIPLARLADRSSRVAVAGVALAAWSAATAACGMATSFWQLLVARSAVSVGEGGGMAPALSYVADLFPPARRGIASAFFAMATPMGALLATIVGGSLAQAYGWRVPFYVFGAAGLILSVVVLVTLRDHRRAPGGVRPAKAPLLVGLRQLWRRPAFANIMMAGVLATFALTSQLQYLTSLLVRVHRVPLGEAAFVVGIAVGLCGMTASLVIGYVSDRVARRAAGHRARVASVCSIVGALAFLAAWWAAFPLVILLVLIGSFFSIGCTAINYAVASMTAPPDLRATGLAVYTGSVNLLGAALGAPVVGAISDAVAKRQVEALGKTVQYCHSAMSDPACLAASGKGLQVGLSVATLALFVAAWPYWRASRTLEQDTAG